MPRDLQWRLPRACENLGVKNSTTTVLYCCDVLRDSKISPFLEFRVRDRGGAGEERTGLARLLVPTAMEIDPSSCVRADNELQEPSSLAYQPQSKLKFGVRRNAILTHTTSGITNYFCSTVQHCERKFPFIHEVRRTSSRLRDFSFSLCDRKQVVGRRRCDAAACSRKDANTTTTFHYCDVMHPFPPKSIVQFSRQGECHCIIKSTPSLMM